MAIVITGARGFIGRNLQVRLAEQNLDVCTVDASMSPAAMAEAMVGVQTVYHLAGVNRPEDPAEFVSGNVNFTGRVLAAIAEAKSQPLVIYASSVQAAHDNPYGASKKAAEDLVFAHGGSARVFRLANVFGKWARPNYNSAVATFCHNVARGQGIVIHDPDAVLSLVHIDDVCDAFLEARETGLTGAAFAEAGPVHRTTVGAVASLIQEFAQSRTSLMTDRVGTGLIRALYSTYISYLAPDAFAYEIPRYSDPRGTFAELLKTPDCGQFSYFTAGPGITRGQHYHHTKTEKFLVLTGTARFGFRHVISNERHEIVTSGGEGRVVETIPGWVHDITNVGDTEMVVMLWANEVFDRERPDTVAQKV